MEGSDIIYWASNSLRRSASRWRSTSEGAFSRSSREEEDDEEALKWAALEKLPTYDRLRKGILTTSSGRANEIDVDNLGPQERKWLIDKLVNVTDVDNEKFLLKLRDRIDRYNFIFFQSFLGSQTEELCSCSLSYDFSLFFDNLQGWNRPSQSRSSI